MIATSTATEVDVYWQTIESLILRASKNPNYKYSVELRVNPDFTWQSIAYKIDYPAKEQTYLNENLFWLIVITAALLLFVSVFDKFFRIFLKIKK